MYALIEYSCTQYVQVNIKASGQDSNQTEEEFIMCNYFSIGASYNIIYVIIFLFTKLYVIIFFFTKLFKFIMCNYFWIGASGVRRLMTELCKNKIRYIFFFTIFFNFMMCDCFSIGASVVRRLMIELCKNKIRYVFFFYKTFQVDDV